MYSDSLKRTNAASQLVAHRQHPRRGGPIVGWRLGSLYPNESAVGAPFSGFGLWISSISGHKYQRALQPRCKFAASAAGGTLAGMLYVFAGAFVLASVGVYLLCSWIQTRFRDLSSMIDEVRATAEQAERKASERMDV